MQIITVTEEMFRMQCHEPKPRDVGDVAKAFAGYKALNTKDPAMKYGHYDLGYSHQVRHDRADATTRYLHSLRTGSHFAELAPNMSVLGPKPNPSQVSHGTQDLQVDADNSSVDSGLGVLLAPPGWPVQGSTDIEKGTGLEPSSSPTLPEGTSLPLSPPPLGR